MSDNKSTVMRVAQAPVVRFRKANGTEVLIASGSVLPNDLAQETPLFFPAHDFWPSIPDLLFIQTTFGEIRSAFRRAGRIDRTVLNNLIRRLNGTSLNALYQRTLSGDPLAQRAYQEYNTDILICSCALHRAIHVLPEVPNPNVPVAIFVVQK